MVSGQRDELLSPAVEEWISSDNDCSNLTLGERRKCCQELAVGACFQDNNLFPKSIGGCFHLLDVGLCPRIGRIHEKGECGIRGQQVVQ